MKKIMMKALSSLIAAVMLLSVMVPAVSAIAEVHTDTQTVLNYVSLGDSMTNGLGLAGYDDTGYLEVAPEAYPARFAQWLAGGTGEIAEGQTVYTGTKGTVNLTQLATSAMRIEDLYYILDYGTENAYLGDEWTRTELLGGDSIGNMGQHKGGSDRWGSDGTPWPSVVETFQDSVANADVITLAAGNGNFGVYMLNAVLQAMGMADAGYGLDYSYATLENALSMHHMDDEKKAAIMDVYESAIELLGGYLSEDVAEIAGNRVAYTIASFMLCYEGVLNRILELNPDVEIVLLGLMDTISSETDRTLVGDLTLGRLLRNLYGYLNDYIVSTPASLQTDYADVYGDATFYYAETESVSCLVEVLIEQLQDVDSVSRNRFVKSIIGTESDPGMIWNLLSGVELIDGMK